MRTKIYLSTKHSTVSKLVRYYLIASKYFDVEFCHCKDGQTKKVKVENDVPLHLLKVFEECFPWLFTHKIIQPSMNDESDDGEHYYYQDDVCQEWLDRCDDTICETSKEEVDHDKNLHHIKTKKPKKHESYDEPDDNKLAQRSCEESRYEDHRYKSYEKRSDCSYDSYQKNSDCHYDSYEKPSDACRCQSSEKPSGDRVYRSYDHALDDCYCKSYENPSDECGYRSDSQEESFYRSWSQSFEDPCDSDQEYRQPFKKSRDIIDESPALPLPKRSKAEIRYCEKLSYCEDICDFKEGCKMKRPRLTRAPRPKKSLNGSLDGVSGSEKYLKGSFDQSLKGDLNQSLNGSSHDSFNPSDANGSSTYASDRYGRRYFNIDSSVYNLIMGFLVVAVNVGIFIYSIRGCSLLAS